MAEWTNSAITEQEKYFNRVRTGLVGSGADAKEVIEDLKRHLEAEVQAAGLKIVTEEDLRRILLRIGEPAIPPAGESGAGPVSPPKAGLLNEFRSLILGASAAGPGSTPKVPAKRKLPGALLLISGVLLPLATLIIELVTRMCATTFFDPMPTIWHVFMVAFVPAANFAVLVAVREGEVSFRRSLGFINGLAIGIGIYYSLLYVPLMIPGFIAVIWFGWGLLPLTPMFSLVASLSLRMHLKSLGAEEKESRLPGLWRGLTAAAVLIAVIALPVPFTRYLEQMAVSDSPTTAARGVRWLRTFGAKETLLRDCYGYARDFFPEFSLEGSPLRPEDARLVYFRVTGQPFNSLPPPHAGRYSSDWAWSDDFDWDNGLGGDQVAGRLKGLFLRSSRIDSKVEPDAALAYSEWTMEFKNDATVQREARAQILLPPGAVVSRLTLWVNGEEREAAFGSRSEVRAAYQEVAIQRRRDPVLVTTCGPDRILMQCFPVPPNGGSMKIRIGITEPLVLAKADSGNLRWPVFLERNFGLPAEFKHSVWIESKEPLKSGLAQFKSDPPGGGKWVLHGELTDQELAAPEASIAIQHLGGFPEVWAAVQGRDQVVRQRIVARTESPPSRLVVVVDGSFGTREFAPAIDSALRQIPDGLEFAVMVASDEVESSAASLVKSTRQTCMAAAAQLSSTRMVGGQDNVPVLMRAWDLAAQTEAGVVLWVHGPQPVRLTDVAGLRQRLERRPASPRFLEIQMKAGSDYVTEKLDGLPSAVSVPRFGKLDEDIAGLFSKWDGHGRTFVYERELADRAAIGSLSPTNASSEHVTRLWAYGEVLKLAAKRQGGKATELATNTHLVTPVSGAVVLETKAQFDQAGLTPVDMEKVPVIPEPGTWALLLLGAFVVGCKIYFKRKSSSLK